MINARKCPDPPVGAQTAPGRGWTLAARRRPEEAQSGACAPPQGRPTRPPPISRGRAHLARVRARARARAAALAPAPAARVVRLLLGVGGSVPMQARGSGGAPALHTRSKGTRARARVRIATVRSLRAIGARRAAAACWQHSGTATTQHACTWRSIQAAGARRSRATGSSFGMNSRASQRAGELAGADPANRAPLAHPRQLAGRSRPRVRRRGARFGGGLETDHLNGRPGGREATRCARRPLCGAEDTTE